MLGISHHFSVELTPLALTPVPFGKHHQKGHSPLSGAMLLRWQAWPHLQTKPPLTWWPPQRGFWPPSTPSGRCDRLGAHRPREVLGLNSA